MIQPVRDVALQIVDEQLIARPRGDEPLLACARMGIPPGQGCRRCPLIVVGHETPAIASLTRCRERDGTLASIARSSCAYSSASPRTPLTTRAPSTARASVASERWGWRRAAAVNRSRSSVASPPDSALGRGAEPAPYRVNAIRPTGSGSVPVTAPSASALDLVARAPLSPRIDNGSEGVHAALVIEQSAVVRVVRRACPEKGTNERRLSAHAGARQHERSVLPPHDPCMDEEAIRRPFCDEEPEVCIERVR